VHRTGQGTDAAKRIVARWRHLGIDAPGLLLADRSRPPPRPRSRPC
jgi:hypothetical protein